MFPNLIEATKQYWRQLDELEAAYQKGEVSLQEVDARVAELMAELAEERRATLHYLWQGVQRWIPAQPETLIGIGIVALATYAWIAVQSA